MNYSLTMKLDQFLKWHGAVSTGGEAKTIITAGLVTVNGSIETRRGRKLIDGDQVCFGDHEFIVGEISG